MNLFSSIEDVSRSERQEQAVQKWVDAKLKGILILPTGFGFN